MSIANSEEGGDRGVLATVKEMEEVVEDEGHTTPRSIIASKECQCPLYITATVEELNFQIAIQHQKKKNGNNFFDVIFFFSRR